MAGSRKLNHRLELLLLHLEALVWPISLELRGISDMVRVVCSIVFGEV
jgi:hypothetical protein